jgi:glycosyltransferase involved in cell wall biosynthesis
MTAIRRKESVLFVASGNPKDGVPQPTSFVKSQADSMQQAGWKVFLSIVDDRTSLRGVLRNLRRIRREVVHVKPGVIHAQYGSVTAALAYCVKGRLPLVVSFCGDDLLGTPKPGVQWRVREKCARALGIWAARWAAVVIVKSRNLFEVLPQELKNKCAILPNGVDTTWFVPMDRDACRMKLGWDIGTKIVLFNVSEKEDQYRKNPVLAHETVAMASRRVPTVTLKVMSGHTREEVRWMLNAADCLLVTSLHEGSPNIVKEAMACNLPVVSVPCGDVVERLNGTRPGKICQYDASALAEAIEEVLSVGCRSNGLAQLTVQGLSAATIAKRLTTIYSSVQQGDSGVTESYKTACAE